MKIEFTESLLHYYVKAVGKTSEIVKSYLGEMMPEYDNCSEDLSNFKRRGNIEDIYRKGTLNDNPLVGNHRLLPASRCRFQFEIQTSRTMHNCTVGIHFKTVLGIDIYALNSRWVLNYCDLNTGISVIICEIDELPLVPGRYFVSIGFSSEKRQIDWLDQVASIDIVKTDYYGTGQLPWEGQGYILSQANWSIQNGKEV